MEIAITNEMIEAALAESKRRDVHIHHHFELPGVPSEVRDLIGFLGEFAGREAVGMDWRAGIRENYDVPDSGDILSSNGNVDIKTETIPFPYFNKLLRGTLSDNAAYGRRLINENQVPLLEHYDYVAWGAFPRTFSGVPKEKMLEFFRNPTTRPTWYSLGFLETRYILKNYPEVTKNNPFGTKYKYPCLNIRQSELRDIDDLRKILNKDYK